MCYCFPNRNYISTKKHYSHRKAKACTHELERNGKDCVCEATAYASRLSALHGFPFSLTDSPFAFRAHLALLAV